MGVPAYPSIHPSSPVPTAAARGLLGHVFDAAAVGGFAWLWLLAAGGLFSALDPVQALLLAVVGLLAGHLLADLLGGLVHWFADEFFEEDTPILGPLLIYGFRDHHRDPSGILRHGLLEVTGYNALAALPVLVLLHFWPATSTGSGALHAVMLGTTLSVAMTNQLHRWAHAERVPPVVAWLQRWHLVLSPEGHARHHRRGDRSYCVTAGWWNRPLDAVGLLPALSVPIHRLGRRLRRR